MNRPFSSNLAALRAIDPGLAAQVEACPTSHTQLLPGMNGPPDVAWMGTPLYHGDPQAAVTAALRTTDVENPRLVFFYGIGLGHHIVEYFREPHPQTISVVLIEASVELFRRSLEIHDWTAILADPRVRLMVGVPPSDLEYQIMTYLREPRHTMAIRALVPVCEPCAMAVAAPYYVQVAETVRKGHDLLGWFIFGSPEDGFRGYVNVLQNLPHCAGIQPLDDLRGAFDGVPGIAVSTGPSLQHSFAWLREAQHRAVIVCTDSALRILLKEGITPHAVGCMERVPETRLLFADLPPLPDTWLMANPIIWPESFQGYPGPKLMMLRATCPLGWFFPEWHCYDAGNSVSHLLMTALHHLGCSPILLVGQDLAFDRHSDRTHVAGIPDLLYEVGQKQRRDSRQQAAEGQQECLVEGNDGQPILTMEWYNVFRRAFNVYIRELKRPVYNVIPREYGAKIEAAQWCPPSEVASLLGERVDVVPRIRAALEASPAVPARVYHATMRERLEVLGARLAETQQTCCDVLDAVSLFRQRHNPNYFPPETFHPLFRRVEEAVHALMNSEDDFYHRVLSVIVQGRNIYIAQYAEELLKGQLTPIQQVEEQIECVRNWFNAVLLWSARLERYLRRNTLPYEPDRRPGTTARPQLSNS